MFVSSSMKLFKIYSELKFRHDPPLLYNVEADPQELYKLTRDTFADYDQVSFATLFQFTIIVITNQNTIY